jgi:hypothetical protein
MTERQLRHLFIDVMLRERHHGWTLRTDEKSHEGYCWHRTKRIDLGLLCELPEVLLLHEIAHVDTCRFRNNPHSSQFWRRFDELMGRYLPDAVEPEWSRTHRSFSGEGFVRMCYRRW